MTCHPHAYPFAEGNLIFVHMGQKPTPHAIGPEALGPECVEASRKQDPEKQAVRYWNACASPFKETAV